MAGPSDCELFLRAAEVPLAGLDPLLRHNDVLDGAAMTTWRGNTVNSLSYNRKTTYSKATVAPRRGGTQLAERSTHSRLKVYEMWIISSEVSITVG